MATTIKSTLINNAQDWDINKRYKVGQIVKIDNEYFQNTTGSNGNPLDLIDWIKIVEKVVKVADDYADDSEADAGGVLIGDLYHTSGVVKIRLT